VRQVGRPVDVWRAPADAFVARFLGFGNVFDVAVRGGSIKTPWGPLVTDRPDGPATLVIRPDGLRLTTGEVRGVARAAAFRGDHFLVPVELEGGWTVEVTDRSGAVPPPGSSVAIGLDPSAVVVVASRA
jgi:thiamine transport system ATP-binding protein